MRRLCVCLYFAFVTFINTRETRGEEFNLYGEAGQAYAIEAYIGHPYQKLKVIVDTGSTTLAIDSYPRQDNIFFNRKNSTSVCDSGKEVQAKYSQGMWIGHLASDYILFPSLPSVPEVRTDVALITKSHKFFMNGSGWQGLLGLAYLPVGAWGENVVVESWLDSLERANNKLTSFELKLCGAQSPYNATHYGNFKVIDENSTKKNTNKTFKTPILHKRWYEVGVINVRALTNHTRRKANKLEGFIEDKEDFVDTCRRFNKEKSIVDSGTTNIRLPDMLFRRVVDEIRNTAQTTNVLILDEFWYHAEAACWPEPQEWSLPWLAVDLLDDGSDRHYFTLEIPPQNYMRVITAHNSSGASGAGTVSEFCYKLGLEAGGKETVLGYTAMEGLQVLFNRSAGWIGFQTTNCGPNTRITGPSNTTFSLVTQCKLTTPLPETEVSIKAAQWALFAVSMVAAAVLLYLLAPCVKMLLVRKLEGTSQISMSQATLVEAVA